MSTGNRTGEQADVSPSFVGSGDTGLVFRIAGLLEGGNPENPGHSISGPGRHIG
jgi:hypothetical protein